MDVYLQILARELRKTALDSYIVSTLCIANVTVLNDSEESEERHNA